MGDEEHMGPVSFLIVEFPDNKMTGEGFEVLLDLVNRGLVRVLDFRFVTRDRDGSMRAIELADFDRDGTFDYAVFDGVSSGLLDDGDLTDAAAAIEPGSSAGILIVENRWAAGFTGALRRSGAELVAAGYIPLESLTVALDATEAANA